MHAARVRLAVRYLQALDGLRAKLRLPACPADPADHSWHLFPVRLNPSAGVGRDEFIQRLAERGIATSVHYRPLHRMSYYAELTRARAEDLPVGEDWGATTVSLPLFSSMTDDEQDAVVEALRAELH